jgi:hypothetical protein
MIVSLPPATEQALTRLSRRDRVPRATKAAELLSHAIEFEEDAVWDALASKRDTKHATFVSHASAWSV